MRLPKRLKRVSNLGLILTIAAVLALAAAYGVLQTWYHHNLSAVSTSTQTVYFTVEPGDSVKKIGRNLKLNGLIRSTLTFESYVRSNQYFDKLQAGTYSLSPSMNVPTIVGKFTKGEVTKNLVTILPGKRLDQIKQAFSKAGFSDADISIAFDPKTYSGLPALASLPTGSTLEGYLYPDSFQKDSATTATDIVRESLNEFAAKLTPSIIQGISTHNLNIFQGITLASVVYAESDDRNFEPTIAQVFLSRLDQNMPLGSDVTAFYGSALAGVSPSVNFDTAYNTRLHQGLPPGPIGNFNQDALKAVAFPSNTDYLYFVADENKDVHFTHTEAEHQDAINKYCAKACSQ